MTCSRRFSLCLCVLSAFCLAAFTGCGPEDSGAIPVTGTVTLDDKPLEGASVNFTPADTGRTARGTTDASGNFVLTTENPQDGALPGTYDVGITKLKPGQQTGEGDPGGDDEEEMMLSGAPGPQKSMKMPESLVPTKYTNPKKSGISIEVKEGMEPVTIELKS